VLEIVKDRTLVSGQEVSVYRNLNRKCFSIKDKKTGLVCAYADKFRIENVKCKVSEAGRQRVLREKRKNVHAMLNGIYIGECEMDTYKMDEVYYDPYTLDSFINKRTGEKLTEIDLVYFEDGKAYMLRQ
jgi:hypothetical protein